jgi:hypothetical protein
MILVTRGTHTHLPLTLEICSGERRNGLPAGALKSTLKNRDIIIVIRSKSTLRFIRRQRAAWFEIVNCAIAISYHDVHWQREKRRNVVNLFGLINGRITAVTRSCFHHITRDRYDSFNIMQSVAQARIARRSI